MAQVMNFQTPFQNFLPSFTRQKVSFKIFQALLYLAYLMFFLPYMYFNDIYL